MSSAYMQATWRRIFQGDPIYIYLETQVVDQLRPSHEHYPHPDPMVYDWWEYCTIDGCTNGKTRKTAIMEKNLRNQRCSKRWWAWRKEGGASAMPSSVQSWPPRGGACGAKRRLRSPFSWCLFGRAQRHSLWSWGFYPKRARHRITTFWPLGLYQANSIEPTYTMRILSESDNSIFFHHPSSSRKMILDYKFKNKI